MEATGAALDRTVEMNFANPQPVDGLAPVRYRIPATKLGDTCTSVPATVDMAREGDEPTAVTVTPAASLRGRLTGAAHPSDFVVVLAPSNAADEAQPVQAAYPDSESRFAFSGLRPGPYRIGVQLAAQSSQARWVADAAHLTELELRGGASMEIDLPAPPAPKNP